MRKDITVEVSADRARLEAVVADRNSAQKHVWVKIILATADGLGTAEIMRRSGKSKPSVWRWQERFMTDGVDGLLRSGICRYRRMWHVRKTTQRPDTNRP
jgi:hypothetical protein